MLQQKLAQGECRRPHRVVPRPWMDELRCPAPPAEGRQHGEGQRDPSPSSGDATNGRDARVLYGSRHVHAIFMH